ncbi:2-keto-4-pentenoate hydratase [Leuconostoc citreum]|uniref:2-keto-4-pentenoate hydratase n=1 Tax=Leuconostoc citreum TaxID=33964 RepID=UPI002182445E|nr:2-keto-4-pentenoate hydratase [Leuconostoc citreum]MCS8587168.1 2-keto-4-pentenoate hydratase [Leuconostoc citreum]MCS8595428.1 2-keto-4-pentenoate hydratase [Leuconostoc citreum]MCS8600067.1 2-keto-4-pentenoate hydratase [Leuconostoc citreum]
MGLSLEQQQLAQKLYEAWVHNKPLHRDTYIGVVNDFKTAYDVQDAVMAKKSEATAGYKVSLTSPETQAMFHTDAPLYGAQVASRFVTSPYTLDLTKYNEPLVEVELQFTAKADLTPEMSLTDLLANTTVAPTLEVPDARFKNWFPKLDKFLVLSDSAVGGAVVSARPRDGKQMTVDDLATVEATLYHNGDKVASGFGSEVLGNPLESLQWLVTKLASQGKLFKAGTRATTGTFLLPPTLRIGEWRATFTGGFSDVVLNVVTEVSANV